MAERNRKRIHYLRWTLFIVYLFGLLYFTIFSESLGRTPGTAGSSTGMYNLEPFAEIRRFWTYREQLGAGAVILNLFGNIAAFIPCGYLLPRVMHRCSTLSSTMLIGFLITFEIESTQYLFSVGSFDVDDVLLNLFGVLIGYMLHLWVSRYALKRQGKRSLKIREIRFRD